MRPSASEETISVVEDIVDVLELRIAIETEAAGLTAIGAPPRNWRRIMSAHDEMGRAIDAGETRSSGDLAFHRAIAHATEAALPGLFNYLGEMLVPRARVPTHQFDAATLQDYLRRISGEHHRIVVAIEAGDGDAARAALRMHLGGSRDRLAGVRPGLTWSIDAAVLIVAAHRTGLVAGRVARRRARGR